MSDSRIFNMKAAIGGQTRESLCFGRSNFPKTFSKNKSLPPIYLPTYLPTMEVSNYEKQIFLYGRHGRDVIGYVVGSDGRGGD